MVHCYVDGIGGIDVDWNCVWGLGLFQEKKELGEEDQFGD